MSQSTMDASSQIPQGQEQAKDGTPAVAVTFTKSWCRVCGRVLKNPRWAAIGIGPVCARKKPWVLAELQGQQRLPATDAPSKP